MSAPLIKYPGGKRALAPLISEAFGGPCRGTFHEPFAGSAAVTLHRRAAGEVGRVVLGDLDPWLVQLHREVAERPAEVCAELDGYRDVVWTEERYRAEVARLNAGEVTAARVVTLNKTCFNGLYRRNRSGRWNVGWNKEPLVGLPGAERIHAVAALLSGADVRQRPALEVLAEAGPGDHVYLDPPYVGTWTGYGQGGRFTLADLAEHIRAARAAADRGARVVLSHLDDPQEGPDADLLAPPEGPIRGLLQGWDVRTLDVRASISCTAGGRGRRSEIIASIGPVAP